MSKAGKAMPPPPCCKDYASKSPEACYDCDRQTCYECIHRFENPIRTQLGRGNGWYCWECFEKKTESISMDDVEEQYQNDMLSAAGF